MDTCRICGEKNEMQHIYAREMMYGMRDEFCYIICPKCGCLQIQSVPDNLEDYYGDGYYSYKKRDTKPITGHKDMTRVLDVGCGAGSFLCDLAENGMGNLTGCDPFIQEDIFYDNGVKIYKRTIHEMEGVYDRILLNDSFEHMTDPHEVMDSLCRLLAPDGIASIGIPIFPNIAWSMFGADWYQLDAPRHIFLHTQKSMQYLAEEHGLRIIKTEYDSTEAQFIRSFFYQKDIPYVEQDADCVNKYFDNDYLKYFIENAKTANQSENGDHATFYLMRK